MWVLDKANEIVGQIAGFASISIAEAVGNLFISLVLFFVEFLLG